MRIKQKKFSDAMADVEQSPHLESSCKSNDIVTEIQPYKGLNGTKYSRMDEVNFAENNLLKNFTCSILEYFVSNAVWINTKKIKKLVDKEVRKKVGEEENAGNLHEWILKH